MGIFFRSQSPFWGPFAFIFSSFLFLSLEIIPPLGWLISGFTITPLTLVLLERGRHFFFLGNAFLISFLWLSWGLGPIFFYLFGFVLPAFLIAEWLQKGKGINPTILASTLVPLIIGGSLILMLSLGENENPLVIGQKHIEDSLTRLIDFYQTSGMDPEQIAQLKAGKEIQAKVLFWLMPSLMFIGFLLVILSNFLFIRYWYFKKGDSPFSFSKLSMWHLPDHLIWGVIGAVLLLMIPFSPGRIMGGNVLLVFLVFYLFQGVALMIHVFQQRRVSYWLQTLAFFLLIFWPTLFFVVFLGLADVWVDFRKVRGSLV